MKPLNFSYSEVNTYLLNSRAQEEIVLDIGANQSTLQDFKSAENAGYYCYQESNVWTSPCCNRFICWRSDNDYIVLREVSMDSNLIDNHVKIKFKNTPILEGISVHETKDQVVILLATVASVHRINLPHPKKLGGIVIDRSRANKSFIPHEPIFPNADELLTRKSIFFEVSAETLRDPRSYYVLNTTFNISSSFSASDRPFPVRSCSWINARDEACFALADCAGNISIITMISPHEGKVIRRDLKHSSIIKSLFYHFVPSVISRGCQESEQAALCILSHKNRISEDTLIIALCRDLRIRIWSSEEQECLLSHSVTDVNQSSLAARAASVPAKVSKKPVIINQPLLKKVESTYLDDDLMLAVFLAVETGQKFLIYTLVRKENQPLKLSLFASVVAPDENLIDFVLTPSTIWALWDDPQNETSLSHWEFERKSQFWQNVTLHVDFQETATNLSSPSINLRQSYIENIFKKGRFSLETITKAMSTFNVSSNQSAYSRMTLKALIEEATKAVEKKTRLRCQMSEVDLDVSNTVEMELWEEFNLHCIQFHAAFNKPLSLIADSRTGLVGILRVSNISFIRLNDVVDHVILSKHHSVSYIITDTLTNDSSLLASLDVLLTGVKIINKFLTDDAKRDIEFGIIAGDPVEQVASRVLENYLMCDSNIWEKPGRGLLSLFEKIYIEAPKLLEAIDLILRHLDFDHKDSMEETEGLTTQPFPIVDQFLAGTIGNCVLAESLKQTTRLRFYFTRDLLLFQLLLLRTAQKKKIVIDNLGDLRATTLAKNALFVHAYYSMLWISEKCMSLRSSSQFGMENTLTLLATLELHEYININRSGHLNPPYINDFAPKSIIVHIINHKKCVSIRRSLIQKLDNADDLSNCEIWPSFLPPLIALIAQLAWPISKSAHVSQFLLGYEQFELLDEYSKLLDSWCQFNIHSRQFIQGLTKLYSSHPRASLPFFYDAISGINDELFLQKIFQPNLSPLEALEKKKFKLTNAESSNYFNKLIRLCRLHSLSSVILELATEAIQYLDKSETSYELHHSTFLTTLFMCHLERGSYNQAFQAMILNSSQIQRKDCLRQFTARLYEKQAITAMINYNYGDIADDFVAILEFRARSRDLMQTENTIDFYEILYAYFIKENNYRKAAAISYEYAKRLGQEVNGKESLKKQAECLLLTITSLKLVDKNYAWIIRPVARIIPSLTMSRNVSIGGGSGAKRKHSSDDEDQEYSGSEMNVRRELQDLGIEDVRNEYVLINARYRLLEKSNELNAIAATPLSPEETVTLLIANLLFDLAFQLSSRYNLPYEPILEGLVGKYVYLTELPHCKMNLEAGLMEINECFIENETASLSFITNAEMPAIDKLLFLILAYIEKYEEPNQSRLHRCVAEKLLSSGIPLPAPLKRSYQKRNSPELLYLLTSYDYIDRAVNFAIEFMNGYLGKGSEYFNIEVPIIGSKSIVYFPHQHIKCLLKILDVESSDHDDYKELSKELKEKYKEYISLITSCSRAR